MSPVDELLSKLLKPVRLLCIEDSVDISRCLQTQLHRVYECEIDVANTGLDGLSMFGTNAYDLILLDLVLPAISGLEVLKEIRKVSTTVPVVILTGYAESDMAYEVSKHGIVCLLAKPFTAEAFSDIFRVFRIRARSHEDERFFQSKLVSTCAAGSI